MKTLKDIQAPTLRGIVKIANELNIQKDDVLYLSRENGIYIMLYYGKE